MFAASKNLNAKLYRNDVNIDSEIPAICPQLTLVRNVIHSLPQMIKSLNRPGKTLVSYVSLPIPSWNNNDQHVQISFIYIKVFSSRPFYINCVYVSITQSKCEITKFWPSFRQIWYRKKQFSLLCGKN